MARHTSIAFAVVAAVPYALFATGLGQAQQTSRFAADVFPVMKAQCSSCHSPAQAMGGLDLTTTEGFKKGGASGQLFVPKDSSASVLMKRLRGHGGKPRMPMGFAPLRKEQLEAIAAWIDAGAAFEPVVKKHWSYVAPTKPPLPQVRNAKWKRNPVDAFVLSRLEREGLKPSPEASKETLIRRVALDLTGLPPTPKETDAFLADKRPDAYERLVDRLLASPHYGERQARPWLDLARYADTDGYEKDLARTAWKYRDWVVGAFNRNMPYDRFTVEQIAGDLIPDASMEQLIATGFHRNSMFNREGGVDQAEAHFDVIRDRVDTTATVWLGSTLACARCHDHKYDPFSLKDYYRMAAFYSNTVVIPRGPKEVGEEKWFEPEIQAPSPHQAAQRTRLLVQAAELERRMRLNTPAVRRGFEGWKAAVSVRPAWKSLEAESATSSAGAVLQRQADGAWLVTGPNPDKDTYVIAARQRLTGVTGLRLEALTDPSLKYQGPGRPYNGNFVLTRIALEVDGMAVPLSAVATNFTQPDFDAAATLVGNVNSGWAVSGQEGQRHEMVIGLAAPLSTAAEAKVEVVLEHQSEYAQHALGRFRLSLTSSPQPTASLLPAGLRKLLGASARTEAEEAKLREHYRTVAPELASLRGEKAAVVKELAELEASIPTALILREKPSRETPSAYVRTRGEFLSKGEKVTAATPAALPPLKGRRADRLALAQWLVRKDNPLTARVQVNRMWEAVFGRGIVETSEDFGTQSAKPSHFELLDWLASEFVGRGWDMKAMHRLIVTSATYRQASRLTPALLKRDPHNILLARGPRFRMEAEMVRDNALRASGLLDPKLGGPSVFPYQPDGVWDNPFSNARWTMNSGSDRYRRGLYTFLKRTAPFPSFTALDSTSRETCTVRRSRTNTPLQALALLNDDGLFDAAKALGTRMLKEGGTAPEQRLAYGFRLCTGRRPSRPELDRLARLVTTLRSRYAKNASAAKRLGGTTEQAVWTVVGNVLLNLDETITKG